MTSNQSSSSDLRKSRATVVRHGALTSGERDDRPWSAGLMSSVGSGTGTARTPGDAFESHVFHCPAIKEVTALRESTTGPVPAEDESSPASQQTSVVSEVGDHISLAVAQSRVTGAPLLPLLLGMQAVHPTSGDCELGFDDDLPVPSERGIVDLAMLADFAMGGALRARYGRDQGMPTISMTIHVDQAPPYADLGARAWGDVLQDGIANAHAELTAGERRIGRAIAAFSLRPGQSGSPVLPWDQVGNQVVEAPAPSGPDLQLAKALARGVTEVNKAWTDAHLEGACTPSPRGDGLTCVPTPAMLNRLGNVQGGVLFGLAVAAASGGEKKARLVSGHMQFVSPVDADSPVIALVLPTRRSKRTWFVQVTLQQKEKTVAVAALTLRISSSD
jgi:acyl-coenzyme A thioesterase PaaI-like protein